MATALAAALFCILPARAANPEKYAQSSMLSQGNWVKINVTTPGLQTLTRQTLKNFGFSDPKNVYVYGYGGRMISEILYEDLADDLPAVPVIRKDDGSITFYALDNINPKASTGTSGMEYDHVINPYGDTSYYFLSDRAPSEDTETIELPYESNMTVATSVTRQIVHETDLLQCAESGRDYLGEDFRTTKSQTFNFKLDGNSKGDAKIRVKFGALTSGGQSSFIVSANGNRLSATNNDRIPEVKSSESYYYRTATSVKTAEDVGSNLTVGIEYSQAGVVRMARLDWIEVEYTRDLVAENAQLYFHVNPKAPTAYRISGVTDQAIIWDVTDPGNIKNVKGTYDDAAKTLTIGVKERGLREFMVVEPSAKGVSIAGRFKVANQDIHSLPTPDMVIITPDEYLAAARRIADLHSRHDGMTVHILSPEKIYNEFSSGNADVSAFRKLNKMWYDRSRTDSTGRKFGYCLLFGRPTYDSKRKNPEVIKAGYPTTPIWQWTGSLTETSSYCTDDFIGMLEDETSSRNIWDRSIDIGVGRYSVMSVADADVVADKLEAYMSSPEYGVWRNNIMLIADDGDSAQHLDQAESSMQNMQTQTAGNHFAYEKIYLDAFDRKQSANGLTFPDAKERMLKKWEKEGVSLINYIGHANPKEWGHEKLLTWTDIINMSNQRLPIVYAATCSFGKWDAESVSGGEYMVTNPAGGAIAMITPSRTVFISENKNITDAISKEFFRKDTDGYGQRLGDILRLGKNSSRQKSANMVRYHLIGDPALRLPVPSLTIAVDSIADRPVALTQADSPTLKARSKVRISGHVTDASGNLVAFNGPIQYTLFDAEKSVETHGWGESGKVSYYQDRPSKLATGSAMAKDGVWSATILMPSEIANNYTPAMLTLYGYDTDMKAEANGATERLYVYGSDENAIDDFEGPSIESFGLNSTMQPDKNTLVDANPVVMATFFDDSGINISDAGIGHVMTLSLDSTKEFYDVNNYYVPDSETDGRGSIAYPMTNLEPGEHELTLTVWDNANNSSRASVKFTVGLNMRPGINDLSARYSKESDMIIIKASVDKSLAKLDYTMECFNLNGERVWSLDRNTQTGQDSMINYSWNIQDQNGSRLPRGIYILRLTVKSDDGLQTTEQKKIAIPAK